MYDNIRRDFWRESGYSLPEEKSTSLEKKSGEFSEVALNSFHKNETDERVQDTRWDTVEINGVHYNRWKKNNIQPSDLPEVPRIDPRRKTDLIDDLEEDNKEATCSSYLKKNCHYFLCTVLVALALILAIVLYINCVQPPEAEPVEFTVSNLTWSQELGSNNGDQRSLSAISTRSTTSSIRSTASSTRLATSTTSSTRSKTSPIRSTASISSSTRLSTSSTRSTTTSLSGAKGPTTTKIITTILDFSTTRSERREGVYFPNRLLSSPNQTTHTRVAKASQANPFPPREGNTGDGTASGNLTEDCILPLLALVAASVALFVSFIIIAVTFANAVAQD